MEQRHEPITNVVSIADGRVGEVGLPTTSESQCQTLNCEIQVYIAGFWFWFDWIVTMP